MFPSCAWLVLVLVGASPPSVDFLRDRSEAKRAEIGTVEFQEYVIISFQPDNAADNRARSEIASGLAAQRDRMLEWPAQIPASPSYSATVEDEYNRMVSGIDRAVFVKNLNSHQNLNRLSLIDFDHGRARFDQTDLRNLSQIISQFGLDEFERRALDQSKSLITLTDRAIHIFSQAPPLAVVNTRPHFDERRSSLRIGAIPAWVFNGDYELAVTIENADVILEGQSLGGGLRLVHFTISPDLDYAVTEYKFYFDGEIRESIRLGDYCLTDGHQIPMSVTIEQSDEGRPIYWFENILVSDVVIGVPVGDSMFSIPSGVRTQDVRP